ncbi:drug resistance transporter, EmrB/QacA subfamily [Lentzea xinjiangensis]|uniref:Drug resistance transporter, EmrB/QacA subfamily n=1 Tax=Lentzea xinjiangensis TaxID=402600 RepID=A0A1H9HSH8_9PSEU|nr:MFS transporter [Lentzea xinjiangensis]SEQ65281.1 drug resistance transporter, EmrB/QacA subfamily [Lentzea xinjiangensis]
MTSTNVNPDLESPSATATAQATQVADAPAPDKRRWAAFVIMTVAVFMDMLDGSIVNVALPSIQRDLGASFGQLQWITAGYVFAFAVTLITGGRLGDIYGRRKMFQLGVLGFAVSSLLCGIAMDPGMLVGARLLQGLSAGLMVPQVLSIIHVTFPDNEKGKVFAVHGMVGGVAATVAPLIGGVLVAANIFGWDWRPIFLINVPIGIVGYFMGWKFIPESKAPHALRLDIVGAVLATVSLVMLLFPLTFGRELHWPVWTIASMVLSVGGFAVFIAYERAKQRRDGAPLVPLNLFKARSFSSALGLMLVTFSFTGMFMLALYLFMQEGLGFSPLRNGVTLLAFCIGAFLTASASVIALVPKFGRAVLQGGAVVIALGIGLFLLVNSGEVGSWGMVPALFVIGLGFGALATPISMFALADVPHKDAGAASGLVSTQQQLGFTLGIAVVSLAFFAPLSSSAANSAEELTPQLRQELVVAGVAAERADQIAGSFKACTVERLGGAAEPGTSESCVAVAQDAQAKPVVEKFAAKAAGNTHSGAFDITLWVGLGMVVLAFLLAGALPRRLAAPQGAA